MDYKDLFKKVENAIAVYASELDHSAGGADPEVLLQDRLAIGRERLDNALEALALVHLLEPTHNARFVALMDQFMPKWQIHRQVLNRLPVRQERWSY